VPNCCATVTPFAPAIQPDQFDLDNPDHEEKLGYGRAIMFFTCKVRASERLPVEIKHLAFMEEVWRYTAPKPDYLADEYKCHRDPTLRTTWWTLTIYYRHLLYPRSALCRRETNASGR
jgi:hypothetical protein